jgi:hypothetical protein
MLIGNQPTATSSTGCKAKAKETADKARKAGIATTLLMVLSLVVGAFVACAAAALGGRQRDEV